MAVPKQKSWLAKQLTLRKLAFYSMFHGLHIMIFIIGWWKQATDQRLAPLNTLEFSVWFSRGAGLCLSVDVMLILLPMCRNILREIRPKIRWLPLDESQWFHRQVAYSLLINLLWHILWRVQPIVRSSTSKGTTVYSSSQFSLSPTACASMLSLSRPQHESASPHSEILAALTPALQSPQQESISLSSSCSSSMVSLN